MNNRIDIGLEDATMEVVDLSKELLVLRMAFGKLKAAIADAVAPISAVLVTGLQKAVFWATRLVKKIGGVISALLGVEAVQSAVTKSVSATAKAVKRTVAGFDQLERLGSSSTGTETAVAAASLQTLSPEVSGIVQTIRSALEPLRSIDFSALEFSLFRVGEAFGAMAEQIGKAISWVWFEVLTPFITWVVERLAAPLLYVLKTALEAVTAAITPVGKGFAQLWADLDPVFAFIRTTVLMVLETLRTLFEQLTDTLTERGWTVMHIFESLGQAVTGMWQVVAPILGELRFSWLQAFEDMGAVANRILSFLIDSLRGVAEFLAGAFTGDWQRAWEGLGGILKGSVNTVIGFLNLLLSGVTGAVNGVIRAVNTLKFTAPDWVPGIGGQTFGFNLKTVTAPQIPYLARGAVLPANRPFLAMVGDQRHGTNIEAPLSVIQEAVAVVLGEQLDALMAGFDATVSEIRQLHDTVSGIEVGDTVIGKAARRYERKMAVVNGRRY